MFVSPTPSPLNLYVEILMPDVMILGSGAFGSCLGHEDKILMNEINALYKRELTDLANLFHHVELIIPST